MNPDTLRGMAARRMTRRGMAIELGLPVTQLDRILRAHGIRTNGKRNVPPQPAQEDIPVHGCGGKPPARLMPSDQALRHASVFGMGA